MLAQGDGGGLDAAHAAGTDQQVGLEAQLRHADQVQIARAAADQRPDHGQRAAGIVGCQRDAGAVGDQAGELLDRHLLSHAWNLSHKFTVLHYGPDLTC